MESLERNQEDDNSSLSLLTSSQDEIGVDFSEEQRNMVAVYLLRKHFVDYKSSHCTPLPTDFFKPPWELPNDTDFVFT